MLSLLFVTVTLADTTPTSLCTEGEPVFFSCNVAGGKTVSLCGAAAPTDQGAGVQYRFGRVGAVELAFPQDRSTAHTAFTYARYTRPMVTYLGLKFTNNGVLYDLFQDTVCEDGDECQNSTGVRVVVSPEQEVNIPCVGDTQGSLMSLEEHIQHADFWR